MKNRVLTALQSAELIRVHCSLSFNGLALNKMYHSFIMQDSYLTCSHCSHPHEGGEEKKKKHALFTHVDIGNNLYPDIDFTG